MGLLKNIPKLFYGYCILVLSLICTISYFILTLWDRSGKYSGWGSFVFGKIIDRLTTIRMSVDGLENIDPDRQYIFIANHLSMLDHVLIAGMLPMRLSTVAKRELFWIPILNLAMLLARVKSVHRGTPKARKALEAAKRSIGKYISYVFYGEGTRSRNGKLGKFKNGASIMAIQTRLSLVPLTIISSDLVIPPDKPFTYDGTVVVKLVVGTPLSTKNFNYDDRHTLTAMARKAIKAELEKNKES